MKSRRPTFRETFENSRTEAAEATWERARQASRLRHGLMRSGNYRAARIMGELKDRCLTRTVEILPDQVRVGIDDSYQIGMLSVQWRGHGRFHLPLGSLMSRVA
jgi:hypothetical protein